jgi:UDP-glucose 4-epimerase
MDLADGHVASVKKCLSESGVQVYNLGTGTGHTVLEVLHTFEKTIGRPIEYEIGPRREGDIAVCYAGTQKAEEELGWKAMRDLKTMCNDAWKWQSENPNGYE